ncbi:MAG: single-stranded DNA-binding protein [Coriobacteriales bacterium]|jgi:single-strand DNA-binding protein|nr:single-stranded DNA-binding protein [Coriobacteriales bacterium]
MSINRVVISGNLTRDAELRQTKSGSAVMGIGVAVNDRRKNPTTGEWEDYPNFINCTMFGARAEKLHAYLTKGLKVAIEGKLRYSSWETQEGQKRSKIEVIVDDLEFMSPRNNNSYAGHNASSSDPAASEHIDAASIPPAPQVEVYDDDIPF